MDFVQTLLWLINGAPEKLFIIAHITMPGAGTLLQAHRDIRSLKGRSVEIQEQSHSDSLAAEDQRLF